MPPQPHAERAPRTALLWTTAAFVAAALLQVDRIPIWATGVLIACAAWQLSVAAGKLPALPKVVQLVVTFHTLNGLAAGTVLLVVMGSIKLLETRNRRDLYIVIGAALFVLVAACLARQGLARVAP